MKNVKSVITVKKSNISAKEIKKTNKAASSDTDLVWFAEFTWKLNDFTKKEGSNQTHKLGKLITLAKYLWDLCRKGKLTCQEALLNIYTANLQPQVLSQGFKCDNSE